MTIGSSGTILPPIPSWRLAMLIGHDPLPTPIDELVEIVGILAAGLLAIAAVRWLGLRAAVPAAEDTAKRTDGPAVAFTLPSSLPLSTGVRRVTHNEIHAAELGFTVGIVTVWLARWNGTAAVALLVAFVSGTLGFRRYCSKAFRTTRREPWYALLALVVGGALNIYAA